ncbi:hypothetical protein CCHR01_11250 [Colletotrichum chrysophilum]|uniref:Uncharacterized protein n=1 Tax=Colletotrichum chrysophilum TaxID=1836956 RepID=A0AAD9EEX3_9PEZI|nr:hypothetical protein CCHR01_11250 [Colletotrichum chrysophilum]
MKFVVFLTWVLEIAIIVLLVLDFIVIWEKNLGVISARFFAQVVGYESGGVTIRKSNENVSESDISFWLSCKIWEPSSNANKKPEPECSDHNIVSAHATRIVDVIIPSEYCKIPTMLLI